MINLNWSTILLQMVNFVVMVFILSRVFFKPVVRILDERSQRVTEALEEAERREREAIETQSKYDQMLAQAQEEVMALQQQAEEDLAQTKQRVLDETRDEVHEMRDKAERDLAEARQQAIVQHQRELGHLTTSLSGRLMRQAGGAAFQEASLQEFVERLSRVSADEVRQALADDEAEVVQVQLASAQELDAGRRAEIEAQLDTLLQRPLEVRYRLDPALVAGATLRFGEVVVDGSLAGQLQTLSERYLDEVGQETT
jgi:F-type H+-transporting ATPase subunit b